ncbi:hypothetical protein ABZ023_03385 [Streptomyces sp. NPDC006367]|uniref:hypothetical protein n=1 Tax=unclassified Streptomyces TaxID=2593676 RepID=UPI0033B32787
MRAGRPLVLIGDSGAGKPHPLTGVGPANAGADADRITFRRTLVRTCTDSYRHQATQDERQGRKR